jgi:carbon storage regulator CsrA
MLVLSRKSGERIHIGEDIVVEIRRIAGNRVTLALRAPRDVRILRGELEAAAKAFDEPEPSEVAEEAGENYRQARPVILSPIGLISTHESGTHLAM